MLGRLKSSFGPLRGLSVEGKVGNPMGKVQN